MSTTITPTATDNLVQLFATTLREGMGFETRMVELPICVEICEKIILKWMEENNVQQVPRSNKITTVALDTLKQEICHRLLQEFPESDCESMGIADDQADEIIVSWLSTSNVEEIF